VYLPAAQPGALFTNPALARTYRRLLEAEDGRARVAGRPASTRPAGRGARGFVAEAVDAFAKQPFQHPGSDRFPA
jgi:gamma-glutamyltranspeptidase/glutathione hydrolase